MDKAEFFIIIYELSKFQIIVDKGSHDVQNKF
jgi:hypothetical protein